MSGRLAVGSAPALPGTGDPALAPVGSVPSGVLLCLAGTLAMSMTDALIKYQSRDYSILEIGWFRFAVQAVILFAVVPRARVRALLRTRRPILQLFRSAMLVGSSLIFSFGLYFIPLAEANAIAFVSPLLITALSVPLLGERVGPRRWAAVVVGFAGVLVIVRPDRLAAEWALLLPLGSAVFSALYHGTTRVLGRTENPISTLYFAALLGLVAVGLMQLPSWRLPGPGDLALLVLMGGFGTLGQVLVVNAFRRAPASVLSPLFYASLLWATVLGYFIFGNLPDRWTIIGASLIVVSGLYVSYRERRLARRTASPEED